MNGDTYLSDYFGIDPKVIEDYGAFNTSPLADIPVFIDPFLLFHSEKTEYVNLHAQIIRYLGFLRDKSLENLDEGDMKNWFYFPEVKETSLGFTIEGNNGRGLGKKFADSLKRNFSLLFSVGTSVTKGQHLEKLCLIEEGVGKDTISDFVTNLIKDFLCDYTQEFAQSCLPSEYCQMYPVEKVSFNYDSEAWVTKWYYLPRCNGKYVLIVPKDLLTSEDTWINRSDLLNNFVNLPQSIENESLRSLLNNYIEKHIPQEKLKDEDARVFRKRKRDAIARAIEEFPAVLDYYIRDQENDGDTAISRSSARVFLAESLFVVNFKRLIQRITEETKFYDKDATTVDGTVDRLNILSSVLQNGGAELLRDSDGSLPSNESDLNILKAFLWGNKVASADLNADKKKPVKVISKLASNRSLANFLDKQKSLNEKDIQQGKTPSVVSVFCFSELEYASVKELSKDYDDNSLAIVIVRAMPSNLYS